MISKHISNIISALTLTSILCLHQGNSFATDQSFSDNPFSSNNFYIGLKGGISKASDYNPKPLGETIDPIGIDNFKDGFAASIVIGYTFTPNIRNEFEIIYKKHIFNKFTIIRDFPARGFRTGQVIPLGKKFGYADATSYMYNLYFDYANESKFTPFIGGGIGLVHYRERDTCGNDSMNRFAFQITPGINYTINDK